MWLSAKLKGFWWPAGDQRHERQRIFAEIHSKRIWGDGESASGPGSGVVRASVFRCELEALLRDLGVSSVLDAPCGDFNWLPTFELGRVRVIGVDIVADLIATNQQRNLRPGTRFIIADMVTDPLPQADLVFCRDGLVHLTNEEILKTLANFRRSGARWLLTTTFVARQTNPDIRTGEWRPLNLEKPPFNLLPPVRLIDEHCMGFGGAYRDKYLALWSCQDLPDG
jgi:SAM-dependent methyltransferase